MTKYIASISYGKDSLAMLEAIKILNLPLDRIVTVDVWATDTIPADLPPMVEFKAKADKIIKERYGIEVEHLKAVKNYNDWFYQVVGEKSVTMRQKQAERLKALGKDYDNSKIIYGFPMRCGAWCNSRLKVAPISKAKNKNDVSYIGIAVDDPERIKIHPNKRYPLVEIEWSEADCRKWCEDNNLLSPIYTDKVNRGGCWFCHNQPVSQLRDLKKEYPEYWKLLLLWDKDSPIKFKQEHTVRDFDRRFAMEDLGLVPTDRKFKWRKGYIK